MEYHKTKDILYVMKLLGHNNLKTTLIYIDLEKAIFREVNDGFTVRVAEDLEEACKLLEVGFNMLLTWTERNSSENASGNTIVQPKNAIVWRHCLRLRKILAPVSRRSGSECVDRGHRYEV